MPTVLITGANRGIGLEFARQYSPTAGRSIATARESSPELERARRAGRARSISRDADGSRGLPEQDRGPLDLFIANAGTNHPMNSETARGCARLGMR